MTGPPHGISRMIGAAALRQIAGPPIGAKVRRLREMLDHEVRHVAEQAGAPAD